MPTPWTESHILSSVWMDMLSHTSMKRDIQRGEGEERVKGPGLSGQAPEHLLERGSSCPSFGQSFSLVWAAVSTVTVEGKPC